MSVEEVRDAARSVQERKLSEPVMAVNSCGSGPSDTVVPGEVITCATCLAFLNDLVRESPDGSCADCGTHLKTMKKQQERKARLLVHFEQGGVL